MSLRRICDQCHQPMAPDTLVLCLVRRMIKAQQMPYDYAVDYGGPTAESPPIMEFCAWPCLIAYARETAATEDAARNE